MYSSAKEPNLALLRTMGYNNIFKFLENKQYNIIIESDKYSNKANTSYLSLPKTDLFSIITLYIRPSTILNLVVRSILFLETKREKLIKSRF